MSTGGRAIYDANLWETKRKTQVVPAWQTFRYEPFTVDLVVDDGVPFDKSMLATVPQSELDALVTAAKMGLKNKWRYIYEDAKDPRSFTYWAGTFPSTEDEDGSGQYGCAMEGASGARHGCLNKHRGSSLQPRLQRKRKRLKEKPRPTPRFSRRAWATEGPSRRRAGCPEKRRGLIPGLDFSLFDFAKIGLSIAGGGPWLSFALDAVDTMSQVVSGDMSLGDGLLNVAKGAAGVGIGAAASWAGSVAGDTVKSIGLGAVGSVAASVSSAVVQNYVNCYANSAIQALDFDHGFKFDKDKFKEGTKNIHGSALSAALTTAASSTVMAAFGADWNNGKMGFTDATGRDLSFMGAYGKTAQNLAGMASGLSGQLVSAAMGNGFSMNVLSSDDLGLGGNRTGLLSLTLGGDNSGFKLGSSAGWDVSMSAIGNFVGSMDYLTTEMKTDKAAQFFLANNDNKEGMARLTYVNYGNLSGNTVASNVARQIINGDKKLEFGISATDAGHYGHADVANNTIQLNERALEISSDNLGAVGGFTAMMAREGFLIDANKALGTAEWSDEKMRESGAGAILTMAAFNVQKGAMDDLAKNLNIKYEGEWAGIKDKVDYVAKTGDLSGFDATGRDFTDITSYSDKDLERMLKSNPSGAINETLRKELERRQRLQGQGLNQQAQEIPPVIGANGEIMPLRTVDLMKYNMGIAAGIEFAKKYREMFINTGIPYVFGGGHGNNFVWRPNPETGVWQSSPVNPFWPQGTDCSGAPINVMNALGYNIPIGKNTDTLIAEKYVLPIPPAERKEGDLIFFRQGVNGSYPHMAVDAGGGYVYNAWESPEHHGKLSYERVLKVHRDLYLQTPFSYRWNWDKLKSLRK